MALMLIVLLVVTVVTVTVVSVAVRDQESSRTAGARVQARLSGTYVLEQFAARLVDDPFLATELVAAAANGDQEETSRLHPGVRADGNPDLWRPLPFEASSGTIASDPDCALLLQDCYFLRVTDPIPDAVNPLAFTVTATVRTRCAGVESRCVYATFRQRYRSAQFFDFLLSNELTMLAPQALFAAGSWSAGEPDEMAYGHYVDACEASASRRELVPDSADVEFPLTRTTGTTRHTDGVYEPEPGEDTEIASCVEIAYHADALAGAGLDRLDGPIYTADDYITVCGSPALGEVFVSGAGYQDGSGAAGSVFRQAPGCEGTDPSLALERVDAPSLVQPTSESAFQQALDRASGQVPAPLVFDKAVVDVPAQLRFTASGFTLTGVTGGPVAGVYDGRILVVRAGEANWGSVDLLLSGTVKGAVSVVVDGSVAIDGDLVYDGSLGCTGSSGSHDRGCLSGNTGDVLSVTATERIEIWQGCAPEGSVWSCTATSGDRYVHGVFTAPQGYVGVPDWQQNVDVDGGRPTLHFYGSTATRFQGVFGGFGSASSGQRLLLSGFHKNFVHDDRLTKFTRTNSVERDDDAYRGLVALPPYLVAARIPVWLRLDVLEVPVDS